MAAPVLGILAGSGSLPRQLVEACRSMSRPVFVLGFEGNDVPELPDVPYASVRIDAIGEALTRLREAGVSELVLAGSIRRPSFSSLRPDAAGVKLLARLGTAFFLGDDALLKAVVGFLESEGFKVVGANEVMETLLAPEGTLGKIAPDAAQESDIKLGFKEAKALGKRDKGQAVIVADGKLLGKEDENGTDALIDRCAGKTSARSGVLVKAKKPGQESRVDLPAIGVSTVVKIHAAGFAGIAIEAGGGIILDKDEVIAKADSLGIFVVGVPHG